MATSSSTSPSLPRTRPFAAPSPARAKLASISLWGGGLLVAALILWQAFAAAGAPDPTRPHTGHAAATLDIAVLVFREGLECVLVLSAITAGLIRDRTGYRRPIGAGAAVAFVATLITWFAVVGAIDALAANIPALQIQAATGLLAIVVLLVVMNWFFHRVYWAGWIGMHNRRKRRLLDEENENPATRRRILWGLGALGFTSLYREGFEVVLFLQSYRLELGGRVVLGGAAIGGLLAGVVAILTFVARARLPYRRMLVITGGMLGVVLLVMVGEQAQEMQLAHWLPTHQIAWLAQHIPAWMGLWFAVFPTAETLLAQLLAALLVIGSYLVARPDNA